jgi:hypothetical protein
VLLDVSPPVVLWTITPSACDEVRLPVTVAVTVSVGFVGSSSKQAELTGLQPRIIAPPLFTSMLPLTVTSEPVTPNTARSAAPG